MITEYNIHNFKSHKDTTIQLAPLTILTGVNGTGKSSVFQSMLMLRETYVKRESFSKMLLSGDSFRVGTVANLVNVNVSDDKDILRLSLSNDSVEYSFSYRYLSGESVSLPIIQEKSSSNLDNVIGIPIFTDEFQYLSAFRYGPQLTYDSDTDVVDNHRQVSQKMGMGEFAVYFLAKYGETQLALPGLKHKGCDSLKLKDQVQCWMGDISEGLQIKLDQVGKQYNVSYGYWQKGRATSFFTPLNTGYGISYILSVIVALLSARPGALLLIENPEAHIHPSGQAALMRLIGQAAANGVQVILETHSDHIVNGALVAVHEKCLGNQDVSLNFFSRSVNDNATALQRLSISETGRIKKAPKGFFDQIDIDLKTIMGF